MAKEITSSDNKTLQPYVSGLGAFALSVGTSIGWGSLIVSNSEYLAKAGPVGSIIGLSIGALIMLIMAQNFFHMVSTCPDSGGAYVYIKTIFGYDRAFVISWFINLVYIAVFWANATSVPLFARYFFGNIFEFGKIYSIFGYDIYMGEILLTLLITVLFGLICIKSKKLSMGLMIGILKAWGP